MATWIEKAKTQFSITMGDGSVYTPLSFNANRSSEYNFAEFDFRGLDGTLVDRRRKRGMVYNLELYFQGGNNLDLANSFQKSADNRNPWTIAHQFYGQLIVQPISPVFYDNSNKLLNATKITVTVRETLTKSALIPTQSAGDIITANQTSTASHLAAYYVNIVPIPKVRDINQMENDLNGFQQALKKISDILSTIVNGYKAANAAIDNAIADVSSAISTIQYFLALPAFIADTIINRVNYINGELNSLYNQALTLTIPPIPSLTQEWSKLKSLWMTEAGTCVSAMCLASVTNIAATDYAYNSQVMTVIGQITTAYNSYLANLDAMQTPNGGELNSFVPDPTCLIALDDLVNYTINNLYTIQANSKQPRTITLTKDSNVIYIAWQLYGLAQDDSTINQIIQDNDITGNELIQVLKGRNIVYYV